MRREFACALLASVATALAASQPAPVPAAASAPPAAQTAYYAGPGVVAPELLPIELTDAATGRCKHLDTTVLLAAIVDAAGAPHNVYFLRPAGNALDTIALKLILAERFKPGTHDGAPAATVDSIEANMRGCIEKGKNESGQKVEILHLQSVPRQKLSLQEPPFDGATLTLSGAPPLWPGDGNAAPFKVGGGISAPRPIFQPEAMYSDKARQEKLQGTCVIGLVVDEHGMPQNVHMIKSLEPSMDQNALTTVSRYRFKPGMKKDGTPVPTMITVEIDFHLY